MKILFKNKNFKLLYRLKSKFNIFILNTRNYRKK